MASVMVQIDGVLWDKAQKKGTPVVLYGQGSLVGLGVGGGPIMPPDEGAPHPEHPIVIPPSPPQPPQGTTEKPPPDTGGWGYMEGWGPTGWGYFPGEGEATPK